MDKLINPYSFCSLGTKDIMRLDAQVPGIYVMERISIVLFILAMGNRMNRVFKSK
jgi:hypothetical protein